MVEHFWMNVMAHKYTNPHNEICKSNGQTQESAPILSDEECKEKFESLRKETCEYNMWEVNEKNNLISNTTVTLNLNLDKRYDINTFIDFSLMVIDIIKEKRENFGCYPEGTYDSIIYGTVDLDIFLDFNYLFEKYKVFKFYSDLQAIFLSAFTYKGYYRRYGIKLFQYYDRRLYVKHNSNLYGS